MLVGALQACGTPSPPGPPPLAVEVPAAWSEDTGAALVESTPDERRLVAWWARFSDPALADLVRLALQDNPSVLSARALHRQAQASRDASAAALGPTLEASASAQRGFAGGRSTGNALSIGVDAAWQPDVSGAQRAAVAAAEAAADASLARLGDTQVQVASEVALTGILLRSAQARQALAEANLTSLEDTLQITQWRERAGLVTALESEQARTAVAQGRAALPPLQTSIAQARHALAVLTGRAPTAWPDLAQGPLSAAMPPEALQMPPLAPPAEALRQRADVRAAEQEVAAAWARVGQAEAARWPSFSIGGTLALNAATLGALGQGGAGVGSLLAGITLPVFDGGARRAQVRVQQAALDNAAQAHRATVLAALQGVEDALVALRGDQLRTASLRIAAEAASTAADLARQRYRSGLADFQAVLETQRALSTSQDSLATARADVSGDLVRLFTALGGGWSLDKAEASR